MGTVSESLNEAVKEGDRFYGFFPMADSVAFSPGHVSRAGNFTVPRADPTLAAVYNRYTNLSADSFYTGAGCEDAMLVYRPLFLTAFMLDDYVSLHDLFGATQVLLTSASSKTAFALAYMLKLRGVKGGVKGGVKVVGLTSPGNVEFCENLGLYDSVVAYADVSELSTEPSVVVDMAGSHEVNVSLDKHLSTSLLSNIGVGLTHNTVLTGDAKDLSENARAVREFFFAPSWIKKRVAEDPTIVSEGVATAYASFVAHSDAKRFLTYEQAAGVPEWGKVYAMFAGIEGGEEGRKKAEEECGEATGGGGVEESYRRFVGGGKLRPDRAFLLEP